MNDRDVKAVLWDMDGVVADTAHQHFQSWQFAFEKQGFKFSETDFQHVFGQRNDTIIGKIMGQGLSRGKFQEVAKDKEEFFRAAIKKDLKPLLGVIPLLRSLKDNGIRSAIASSAPMENIQLILDLLKIREYFQALVYGQEVSDGKPSPQVFQLAAKKLGAEARNCIVIEDAVAGVKAAKAGGMRCIAVTNTHPVDSLKEADLVVDSLEKVGIKEIVRLLES